MSPTNPNSSNSSGDGSNITVSYNDHRCKLCGHNRSKCLVCHTSRSHFSAADQSKAKKDLKTLRKVYCCKCKHSIKRVRYLCIVAAIKLRRSQSNKLTTTCGELARKKFKNGHGGPGSGGSSLVVSNCRMPDYSDVANVAASELLEYRVLQVENIVLRLILLLANDNPIDIGILRTVLRTLFNQLATLTHRAFPALMPNVLTNRKAFQHSLGVVGRGVQVAYKQLWVAALQTGVLGRSHSHVTSTDRLSELDTLILESGERGIASSHDAGVQQLLWNSRELADELRFWLALLRGGRSE